MTEIQMIRNFASYVANEKVVISRIRDEWSIHLQYHYPYMSLPEDIFENDEEDKIFRKDFVTRCPMAQGFANVTLTILHEIGHHFTREIFDAQDLNAYYEVDDMDEYLSLPCERAATDWAIAWLADKEHRKVAKAFERQIFSK